MKLQRRVRWQWMPFLLTLFLTCFISILSFHDYCQAARRRPYAASASDHDFPYTNCSLRVVDADVRDVLRAFADKYKLSIIMSEDVKGKISIIVNNIPVKEAFEGILEYADLGYMKEGDIYRIRPLDRLLKKEELNQYVEELNTEVILLKHANAERLVPSISKFKSNLPEAVIDIDKWTNSIVIKDKAKTIEEVKSIINQLDVADPPAEVKELTQTTEIIKLHYLKCQDVAKLKILEGKASAHEQTNSVIITDLPEKIAHLISMINDLDKPICQILIEARIVETTKSFSHTFGIQWGGHYKDGPPSGKTFPTVTIGGAINGTNFNGTPANYAVNVPGTVNPYGDIDILLGHIKDKIALNMRLSAMEDSGNGRIISQPRIMTLDNTMATISTGEIFQLPPVSNNGTTVVTGGQYANTASDNEKEAKTRLTVVPHTISSNEIKLSISINRDTPDFSRTINNVPVIITREAETELILSDGETAVIGGLATTAATRKESGVPWLSKIPLLGWFFKGKTNTSEYGELLVFITPHIVQAQTQAQN
ncbi:MAG: secretin N-terminal domain-containing protein [bacterium]